MNYFATLGKPETDPDRIKLREQHVVWNKTITARNTAIDRKEEAHIIADLDAAEKAQGRAYKAILDRIVARPYRRASSAEPQAKPVEEMPEEDED